MWIDAVRITTSRPRKGKKVLLSYTHLPSGGNTCGSSKAMICAPPIWERMSRDSYALCTLNQDAMTRKDADPESDLRIVASIIISPSTAKPQTSLCQLACQMTQNVPSIQHISVFSAQ